MESAVNTLTNTLKSNGYSLTRARRAVFMALLDHEPQTIAELSKALKDKLNRASLYRTVSLYEQLGIINRLQLGWKYKLELSEQFGRHHHHITCMNCGSVNTIQEHHSIEHELERLAAANDYVMTGHQLELRGLCKNCRT